jgi:hypothetical protein
VVGAADSQTGTEQINNNLGVARAQYIAEYLTAQGVLAEKYHPPFSRGASTLTRQHRRIATLLYPYIYHETNFAPQVISFIYLVVISPVCEDGTDFLVDIVPTSFIQC